MIKSLSLIIAALTISACTQVITATTEQPLQEDPSTRSLGSYIDDEIIETKISVNIRNTSAELEAAHINAVSHNGIVLLTGQAPNNDLVNQAFDIAEAVKKVRKVHNEISIGENSSMLARSNDTWISTKVKSKLSLNSQLDASRIKVVTENGTVYLMGLVSQAEAETASKVASETSGVQKVVRVFEYY
ncbi:putative periplasmic or secreted lipoprotein [Spongiibacter sp. IMCC21906]|jgi:osmotically-inducible protein OsmY|uniref:BON domain-containing protein n=1 Tax=Spongiibacter sp. IMCC21906 TaxID=1620392 RepID=UPI00062DFCC4|nr:BON domain-containing protein [Spongiibacter sp. IMCC21906]AKH68881.1 putative periplasmic or secreted lipoprotein [Spongiibacter sp. IMCC21906]